MVHSFVKEKKTERELYSLLMSLTKESEKIALIKKIQMNDNAENVVEIERRNEIVKSLTIL